MSTQIVGKPLDEMECLRCGSPIKGRTRNGLGQTIELLYYCGSEMHFDHLGRGSFNAMCSHRAKQTPKPLLHIASLGSLPTEQLDALRSEGFVVFNTGPDVSVSVISAEPAMANLDEIGLAALEAMQGPTNDSVRAKFAEILFKKLTARISQ